MVTKQFISDWFQWFRWISLCADLSYIDYLCFLEGITRERYHCELCTWIGKMISHRLEYFHRCSQPLIMRPTSYQQFIPRFSIDVNVFDLSAASTQFFLKSLHVFHAWKVSTIYLWIYRELLRIIMKFIAIGCHVWTMGDMTWKI